MNFLLMSLFGADGPVVVPNAPCTPTASVSPSFRDCEILRQVTTDFENASAPFIALKNTLGKIGSTPQKEALIKALRKYIYDIFQMKDSELRGQIFEKAMESLPMGASYQDLKTLTHSNMPGREAIAATMSLTDYVSLGDLDEEPTILAKALMHLIGQYENNAVTSTVDGSVRYNMDVEVERDDKIFVETKSFTIPATTTLVQCMRNIYLDIRSQNPRADQKRTWCDLYILCLNPETMKTCAKYALNLEEPCDQNDHKFNDGIATGLMRRIQAIFQADDEYKNLFSHTPLQGCLPTNGTGLRTQNGNARPTPMRLSAEKWAVITEKLEGCYKRARNSAAQEAFGKTFDEIAAEVKRREQFVEVLGQSLVDFESQAAQCSHLYQARMGNEFHSEAKYLRARVDFMEKCELARKSLNDQMGVVTEALWDLSGIGQEECNEHSKIKAQFDEVKEDIRLKEEARRNKKQAEAKRQSIKAAIKRAKKDDQRFRMLANDQYATRFKVSGR